MNVPILNKIWSEYHLYARMRSEVGYDTWWKVICTLCCSGDYQHVEYGRKRMTYWACPSLQSSQHMILQFLIFLLQLDPTSIIDGVAVTGLYELSMQLYCQCAMFKSLQGNWTCMTRLSQSHEQQQQYYFHTIYLYL